MSAAPWWHETRLRLAALLALGVGLLSAGYLLTDHSGTTGLTLLALHAALPLVAVPVLLCAVSGAHRRLGMALGALTLAAALLVLLPVGAGVKGLGVHAHAVLGLATAAASIAAWVRARKGGAGRGRSRLGAVVFALCVLPALGVYAAVEQGRRSWQPPRYDAAECYRFLTATTVEQAEMPNFPSALRVTGEEGSCLASGCHADVHTAWQEHGHAAGGSTRAYAASYADFIRRRGAAAGRWCQGCHNPDSQRGPTGSGGSGVGCLACHGVREVNALYGSAALTLEGGERPELARLQVLLRPEGHRHQNLRGDLQRSAEFCASCHRKNWSLPQNGFHWMPGPDQYREWANSPYTGSNLLAAGEPTAPRTCVNCHAPHGSSLRPLTPSPSHPLTLDLFLRSENQPGRPLEAAPAPRPGALVELDVVVHNTGIGHDFPYGMPDLYRTWLSVEVRDPAGRSVLRTPDPGPQEGSRRTAVYTLIALDREGRLVEHGDLDSMTAVREWRRIPAGEADLARYRFRVPSAGLGSVRVRMLRQRRPEFSRWAGEPIQAKPVVLAERTLTPPIRVHSRPFAANQPDPQRLRRYGLALARARLFPQAIAALNAALEAAPDDGETRLALGQVFLTEGDLLAAGERFQEAEAAAPERSRAWQAAVARRSGQPEEAVRLLEPLVGRYPRDTRLRFELGRALMELLRHREAAEQFEALLDVDPLDVAGHHNLMLCWQRLNRPAEARREETLYKLLAPADGTPTGEFGDETRSPSLRVFPLEAVR